MSLVLSHAAATPWQPWSTAWPQRARATGSVGLIVAGRAGRRAGRGAASGRASRHDRARRGDEDDVETRLDLVPAALAKGLEFDHVVLVEPAAIVAGEADERTGLRRLYVCLTRAVTSLTVVHAEPLPDLLAA